ncbi:hypothetical protein AYI69_g6650 [Smittium culicis]|uniref:Transcription factor IIIC subunit 5 HTH domain-containing protein n=1 Tax=Smittium culicis TaxID=133412 RepID=A0A1R1XXL9_9FUNG|nr:hypothetical protein AYI69_g6650 [Smittium culicis]
MDSGPWRDLWIKFGYDMRKTRESFIYQQVNIRKTVVTKPKAETNSLNQAESDSDTNLNKASSTTAPDNNPKKSRPISFISKIPINPYYQLEDAKLYEAQEKFGVRLGTNMLGDIKIKKVVKLLQHPRILQPECTRTSGWIRPDILVFIKQQIKEKINEATDLDDVHNISYKPSSDITNHATDSLNAELLTPKSNNLRKGSLKSHSKASIHIEDVNKILRIGNEDNHSDGYNSINDDSDISDL